MAANGARDMWAIGGYRDMNGTNNAVTEHWDGSTWSIVPLPSGKGETLSGLATVSPTDVWAVGNFDTSVTRGSLTVFGGQTLVDHWNGTAWSNATAPDVTDDDTLVSISAASATDVWAVGTATSFFGPGSQMVDAPLIEHWDGYTWSIVHAPTGGLDPGNSAAVQSVVQNNTGYLSADLASVHAFTASDVWAVGSLVPSGADQGVKPEQTFTEHWNGSTWTIVPAPDVAVAELHRNASDALAAVNGVSGNDAWAVGAAAPLGTLALHWSGAKWTVVPSPETGGQGNLSALAAVAHDDVWAVGDSIDRWDGTRWLQTATVNGRALRALTAIAAVSADDVWMAEQSSFLHYTCNFN